METLPKLYKQNTTGNVSEWEISVIERDSGDVHIVTKHGISDGKMQTEQRLVKGKNEGRANATNAFEQGVREARKKWENKKKAGYHEQIGKASVKVLLPMLAKQYDQCKHCIQIPYAIQPKFDGMRAFLYLDSVNKPKLVSRLGNPIETTPHINEEVKELKILKPGVYLDGELFTFDYPFEELVGLLKTSENLSEEKLEKLRHVKFYVFDMLDTNNKKMTFRERFKVVSSLLEKIKPKTLASVETKVGNVFSEDVAIKIRNKYIKQGYEGVMFRNLESEYGINKRSSDLIKFKKTLDAEYEIIGYEEAKGRDIGTPIFLLKTSKGDQFSARPTGTLESRKEMLKKVKSLIGKMATVEYQELSKKGVPRFPVLVRIRETME
jgi:ATP-dependent DNA ligase